jgi:hypothetical protein
MRRAFWLLVAVAVVGVSTAQARIAMPPPGPFRIINSDAVFVARVTGIEPADIEIDQQKYRVGVAQVTEIITGLKAGTKTVRIAFHVVDPNGPRLSRQPQKVDVGQQGLFMVSKLGATDMVLAPNPGYFVPSEQPDFKNELEQAKKAGAIVTNPLTALKSKDSKEQMFGVQLLLRKYREVPPGVNPEKLKQEPIDAEESKLILNAIASADWNPQGRGGVGSVHPIQYWSQLGVTEKDGWKQPVPFSLPAAGDAVRAWVRANGDTYRIQRYVVPAGK